MTFIAGFDCSDGLVLVADRLESDGINKKYRQKLEARIFGEEWGVAWGGSGTAYLVDKFTDHLTHTLKGNFLRGRIVMEIEAALQLIDEDHSPDGIDVVIGLYGHENNPTTNKGHEMYLYRGSSKSRAISEESEYAIAGMDVTLAQFVLRNTFHKMSGSDEVIRLGVFVTALMKEYAADVGGPTDVYLHKKFSPFFESLNRDEITQIESNFPIKEISQRMAQYWREKNPANGNTFLESIRRSISRKLEQER